jgi:hypothetical protein
MALSVFITPFLDFLSLGQTVNAIVLDDIGHVDAAPDRMRELTEPDRGRVAVAGDAEINQFAIGQIVIESWPQPAHSVEILPS